MDDSSPQPGLTQAERPDNAKITTMNILLKNLECPARGDCNAFHCLFAHPERALTSSADKKRRTNDHDESGSQSVSTPQGHGARKRLKSQDRGILAEASGVHGQLDSTSLPAAASTKALKTATRPVSPRPVSRNRAPTNKQASSSPKTATKPITASSRTHSPSPSKPVEPPRHAAKPETLNPRLLKSSPASHEIRLKLLKMLHQQFGRLNLEIAEDANKDTLPLVLSDQELIIKALDEEEKVALEKTAVYSNVMKNKVMQYKRMTAAQWRKELEEKLQASRSNNQESDPAGAAKKIETSLSPSQQVQLLEHLLTPTEGLRNHGYVTAVPTEEDISTAIEVLNTAKGWEQCDRCRQRFQVFPGRRAEDGILATGGACQFHWGKTYLPERAPNDTSRVAKRYQCCGQEMGESRGCITHGHHVFKHIDANRLASVLNFAQTPQNSLVPPDRAVCFDCEMGYTVHGMELIRLTATEWPSGQELLDVLVQPLGEILDLNSRFSGVWPDDLAYAEPWTKSDSDAMSAPRTQSPQDEAQSRQGRIKKPLKKVSSPQAARELLFSLIAPSTPLIGHGLENDLNAVRIVHPNLIDTVLLYPHKVGLPYRYSLKTLMAQHLNRTIQQESGAQVRGHDSAEDARAAGDLVRLKVVQLWKDLKLAGWSILSGKLVQPAEAVHEQAVA